MKNINEYFAEQSYRSINESIQDAREIENVDEGLKDIMKAIKDKFVKIFSYFTGLVARISSKFPVWLAVNGQGETMPAQSACTAGQAYVDGYINKKGVGLILDKQAQKISGCKTGSKDVLKVYGDTNPVKFWQSLYESQQDGSAILEDGTQDPYNRSQERLFWENAIEYFKEQGQYDETVNENIFDDEKMEILTEEQINEIKKEGVDPNRWAVDNAGLRLQLKMTMAPGADNLLIFGAPGIGKTAIVEAVMNEVKQAGEKWSLVVRQLASETADNFSLPKYVDMGDGTTKATDVPKDWLPVYHPTGDKEKDEEASNACGYGILFIDEFSRAIGQVQNVMLSLLNEHRINDWYLGKNWHIVSATNRPEDDDIQTEISKIAADRFSKVYYEPTYRDWREWAEKQEFISPIVLQWLSMATDRNSGAGGGEKYFYYDPDEETGDATSYMCTPRGWTEALRRLAPFSQTGKLAGMEILDIPDDIIGAAIGPRVGRQVLNHLLSFIRVVKSIGGSLDDTIAEIWKSGGSKAIKAKKQIEGLALMFSQLVIMAHNNSLPTEKEYANLGKFMIGIDNDQISSYIFDIFKSVFGEGMDEGMLDYIFKAKHLKQRYENTLNNAPDAYRKLKNSADRSRWVDAEMAKVKQNSSEWNKLKELKQAGSHIEAMEEGMKPFLKKWSLNGVDDMPDYSATQLEIGKKYQEIAAKIDMGDGSSGSQF